MRYFEVKKNFDNFDIIGNYGASKFDTTLIGGEIYTEKEFDKLFANTNASYKMFDIVEYPKNQSYYFFGCRFNTKQNR
jgi:hypothetical protein